MKDLGVTFDPELSFNFHCEDKINKAYSVRSGYGTVKTAP